MKRAGILCLLSVLLALALPAYAQQVPSDVAQGLDYYGSYNGGNVDLVNLLNGGLFLRIPLGTPPPQRGGELSAQLSVVMNSKDWELLAACDPVAGCVQYWDGSGVSSDVIEDQSAGTDFDYTTDDQGDELTLDMVVTTPDGSRHILGGAVATITGGETIDGTGYSYNPAKNVITDRKGTLYAVAGAGGAYQDRNGNDFSQTFSEGPGTDYPYGGDAGGFQVEGAPAIDTIGRTIGTQALTTNYSGCTGSLPLIRAVTYTMPAAAGGSAVYKFCYASLAVSTDFDFYNPGMVTQEWVGTQAVLQSIVLPNATAWTFAYTSPDGDGHNFGDLAMVTLPLGGTIQYTWEHVDSDYVTSRTVNANDGTGPQTTTYTYGGASPNLVTDPLGNQTSHTFNGIAGTSDEYEIQTQWYQGTVASGTLLKTVKTAYQSAPSPYNQYPETGQIGYSVAYAVPSAVTTIWPNGEETQASYTYDAGFSYGSGVPGTLSGAGIYGQRIEEDDYLYAQGGLGEMARSIATTYQTGVNAAYQTANLLDLPASVTVTDYPTGVQSITNYAYDGTSAYASGAPNLNTPPGVRGNLTSTSRWVAGSSYLTSHTSFYDSGVPATATDPAGNVTSYTYAPATGDAYPVETQYPNTGVAHTVEAGYDFNTGLVTSSTDQNGQVTQYAYGDPLDRPTSISYPDGGQTTFAYNDTPGAASVETKRKIDSSRWSDAFEVYDGMGRAVAQSAANDETTPWDRMDTCYNGVGQVSFSSYPYQGASGTAAANCAGVGDSFQYDALGRPVLTTHSDGTTVITSYTGRATETQDEGNGTSRVTKVTQTDSLGNLSSVCEVTSATDAAGNAPAACGLDVGATGFLTSYTHDALGNLTAASQVGLQARTFTYDGLSRLLTASNPESGLTTYTYDADSNVLTRTRPAPNQKSSATTVTTSYSWDALDRLKSKAYSDGATPALSFAYDQSSVWWAISNPIGRLTYTDAAGVAQESWSYDQMGRPLHYGTCTPQTCGASWFDYLYQYDLAGDGTGSNYERGASLTTTFNRAGRPTAVASNWSDAGHPATLASGVEYNAWGARVAGAFGDGMQEQRSYNARGQATGIWRGPNADAVVSATPPLGSLDSSSASLGQYGILQASGWAADPVEGSPVARVAVLVDGQAIGDATLGEARSDVAAAYDRGDYGLSGWSFSGSIGGLAPGSHKVSAVAYDAMGNAGTLGLPGGGVLAVAANTAPTGFEDEESGSSVAQGGSLTIYGWAADNEDGAPVAQVRIEVDGVAVGNASLGLARPDVASSTGRPDYLDSGWSYTLNVGSLAPGAHAFTAVAYDSKGAATALPLSGANSRGFAVTGSAALVGYFNNIPPSSVYGGSIAMGGWAADPVLNAGASKVEFRVDGIAIAQASTGGARPDVAAAYNDPGYGASGFQATFPLGNVAPGGHELTLWAYDSLGVAARQLNSIALNVTGGNAYTLALAHAPNGDATGAADAVNGDWSYSFDAVNRLAGSACASGCPGGAPASYQYRYDRYGNRWQQDYADGSQAGAQLTFSGGDNRPDGWSYDAAGNLMSDGNCSYTYDAENRLVGASACESASYEYDPEGRRVWESVNGVVKEFVYGASGQEQTIVDASQNLLEGEVFLGGRHLATYTPSLTHFSAVDWLGNERARTNSSGLEETCQDLPFGDGFSCQGDDPSPLHFTGKYRDAETGLSYFGARYYSPNLGRFLTPDWSDDPQPIPYADLSDPQSLNLYAYVENNPVTATDPDGHCCSWSDVSSSFENEWHDVTEMFNAVAGVAFDPTPPQLPSAPAPPSNPAPFSFSVTASAGGGSNSSSALVDAQDAARASYGPNQYGTYCNVATLCIAQAMGAPMGPLTNAAGGPLSADQMAANLGTSPEYREVSSGQAQALANQGKLVIGAWADPSGGHGHVVTVRPEGVPGDGTAGHGGPLLNNIGDEVGVGMPSQFFRPSRVPNIHYYTPSGGGGQ